MFPIMAGMVTALDTAWQPIVAVLMLGCSYAFINLAGCQTSLMVMKPGGYEFFDFVRVGVPLTVVVGAVAIPLAVLLSERQAAGIFPAGASCPAAEVTTTSRTTDARAVVRRRSQR